MRVRTVLKLILLLVILAGAAMAAVLATLDFSSYRSLVAEKVKAATGRNFEIVGDLKLGMGFVPAIVIEDVRLQNAIFGTRAEMIKARRLEANVALLPLLFGRIEISRLVLIGPDILLETDGQGRNNWDFRRDDEPARGAPPATAEQAALELPNLAAITIDNGLLTFRNGRTGKITKLEVMHFTGSSENRYSPLAVDLDAAYDGVPFHVKGKLGAFVTLGSPGPFPVDLTTDVADFQVALKGSVSGPLAPTSSRFSVNILGNSINTLSSIVKMELPPTALALSGQATWESGSFTLSDMSLKLGDSSLTGRVRLEQRKDRLVVNATLSAQQIDWADFRPVNSPAEPDTPSSDGTQPEANSSTVAEDGRIFSADSLPFSLLDAVDGKLEAKVNRLILGRTTIDRAALSARLQNGQLSIDPLSGILAQGELAGAVILDSAQGGGAKLDLKVSNLDVKTLGQVIDAEDILSGKVDVLASVAGRGESVRELMAGLDGSASIIMGKGAVKSSYVDLLGVDLLRFAAITASTGGTNDTTVVNCLVGRFDIAKGLAYGGDILFDTNQMTVKGEGEINLASEQLNLNFTPRPKDMSLLSLAVPWRVGGSLSEPQVTPDETGVATRAAAGALLAVVNPLALLVPLVSIGSGDKNPCLAALEPQQARAPGQKKKDGIQGLIDSIIPGR